MKLENSELRRKIQQKMGFWLLLISAGVVAYGIGLHQGSLFRMNRMIASDARSVPVEVKPELLVSGAPSDTPSNIESPKSHSK